MQKGRKGGRKEGIVRKMKTEALKEILGKDLLLHYKGDDEDEEAKGEEEE